MMRCGVGRCLVCLNRQKRERTMGRNADAGACRKQFRARCHEPEQGKPVDSPSSPNDPASVWEVMELRGGNADRRSPAEHDCDRILYSDELRRLGGVTQVVAVGEMPLFHTRLTHTLKVQQLSRRIAQHIDRNPENKELLASIGDVDPDAAEAAGLAHDLGHPPFGHVGEHALNARCEKAGLDGFEGNAQTFRILTKLSRHGADAPFGLEISDRTLRAVIKYPWLRTGDHESKDKWNAYPTEQAVFERVRGDLPTGHRSVEAAIMDWADDITYALHDLEDFIRAGRVPIVALATDPFEFDAFIQPAVARLSVKKKYEDVPWSSVIDRFSDLLELHFAQFSLHTGSSENLAHLRSAFGKLIDQYVSAAKLCAGAEPIGIDPETRGEIELFKQLTWHYVIHEPTLATLQLGHERVVHGLFDRLTGWLSRADKAGETHRLPRRLRDLYVVTTKEPGLEAYSGNPESRRARAVADYIASLTESQAIDLHERLEGVGAHSVLDPWLAY